MIIFLFCPVKFGGFVALIIFLKDLKLLSIIWIAILFYLFIYNHRLRIKIVQTEPLSTNLRILNI